MGSEVTNVIIAGLGGQGVITASDILAQAVFEQGYDTKKAEIHGMSQRGGSVSSDVRFGAEVRSPMVPAGEADFLVVVDLGQVEANAHRLRPGGRLITVDDLGPDGPTHPKSLNVALLGVLSRYLPMIDEAVWLAALRGQLRESLWTTNEQAFAAGRRAPGEPS